MCVLLYFSRSGWIEFTHLLIISLEFVPVKVKRFAVSHRRCGVNRSTTSGRMHMRMDTHTFCILYARNDSFCMYFDLPSRACFIFQCSFHAALCKLVQSCFLLSLQCSRSSFWALSSFMFSFLLANIFWHYTFSAPFRLFFSSLHSALFGLEAPELSPGAHSCVCSSVMHEHLVSV